MVPKLLSDKKRSKHSSLFSKKMIKNSQSKFASDKKKRLNNKKGKFFIKPFNVSKKETFEQLGTTSSFTTNKYRKDSHGDFSIYQRFKKVKLEKKFQNLMKKLQR